jgi:hypothetical protein
MLGRLSARRSGARVLAIEIPGKAADAREGQENKDFVE